MPTKSEIRKGTQGDPADFPTSSFDTCHNSVTAVVPPETVIKDAVVIKAGTACAVGAAGGGGGGCAGCCGAGLAAGTAAGGATAAGTAAEKSGVPSAADGSVPTGTDAAALGAANAGALAAAGAGALGAAKLGTVFTKLEITSIFGLRNFIKDRREISRVYPSIMLCHAISILKAPVSDTLAGERSIFLLGF